MRCASLLSLWQYFRRILKKFISPRQASRDTTAPTSDHGHQTNSVVYPRENNTQSDNSKATTERIHSELETLREELERKNKELEQLKRQIAELKYELQRQRDDKDKYINEIEDRKNQGTTMVRKIIDLEKQVQLERSLYRDGSVSNSGVFAMNGANPVTFKDIRMKISQTTVKIIESMIKQKTLRYENIYRWYNERGNSFSDTQPSKSVLKRVVRHGISSQLATIWNTVLLNDPISLRPADKVFATHDTIFDEIQALDSKLSKSSKIAMLVVRVGSEFSSLLLNKIPEPMNVEDKFQADVNYDPFSDLPDKAHTIRENLLSFLDAKTDSVIETLSRFGNEKSVRQSRSSIRLLVYLCIHAQLQMEVMGNGEMVMFFAGSASDQSIRNTERAEGIKELGAIKFRDDLYNNVDSLSSAEEDLTIFMTISPGVANIKWEGDRITIKKVVDMCDVLCF
ncbi:hypothetical protein BC936DRAFT_150082 [Jimgerdemannia flammicorona]|uniref:Uncharacterized protein n=1 Tax=Jimgerdemannia flammicorona TaxID=994334 RepID=A0A433CZJ3_9FUNG|nr:hypothetical protein BC936DRAFT_150082 [Jimgerdemannia flammicorona]